MSKQEEHYEAGQLAALRGCWRVLHDAPSDECRSAWYAGFDSVPHGLRGSAPLTGPIPQYLLREMASAMGKCDLRRDCSLSG